MAVEPMTETQLARKRAMHLTGLLWHVNAFAVLCAFFWVLDAVSGEGGVQWAHWLTVFWGVALSLHVAAWVIESRRAERRRAERSLTGDHHASH